jgi:hypothetical protein
MSADDAQNVFAAVGLAHEKVTLDGIRTLIPSTRKSLKSNALIMRRTRRKANASQDIVSLSMEFTRRKFALHPCQT